MGGQVITCMKATQRFDGGRETVERSAWYVPWRGPPMLEELKSPGETQ
jgi:hypothetical protein